MIDNFDVLEKKILRLAESSTNKNVKLLVKKIKNADFEEPRKQAGTKCWIFASL